jgi:hypothetical protein
MLNHNQNVTARRFELHSYVDVINTADAYKLSHLSKLSACSIFICVTVRGAKAKNLSGFLLVRKRTKCIWPLQEGHTNQKAVTYCKHQFTWRLHATVEILAWLVTARFMQRNSKTGIHRSENTRRGGVRSAVIPTHCSYCACNGEIFSDGSIGQSMRTQCHTNSLPHGPPSLRRPDKWCEQ